MKIIRNTLLIIIFMISCQTTTDYDPVVKPVKLTYIESGVNVKLSRIQFVNDKVGYCSGHEGTILKTVDAGETWSKLNTGITDNLQSIHFINETTGWAVGYPKDRRATKTVILKTTDGGKTWVDKGFTLKRVGRFYSVKFANETVGWAVGSYPTLLYKTTDGGDTWQSQTQGLDTLGMRKIWETERLKIGRSITYKKGGRVEGARMYYAEVIDEKNIWLGGRDGFLWRTTDGGNTWKYDHFGNINATLDIQFLDKNTAITCGSNGQVFRLDKKGNTLQHTDMTNYFNTRSFRDIYFINKDIGFAFGEHGYIYKTINGGKYWGQELNLSGINILYSSDFIKKNIGFAVGNGGTIIKIEDPLIK